FVFLIPRRSDGPWATSRDASRSKAGPTATRSSHPLRWPLLPWRAFPSPSWGRLPMSRTFRRFEILLPLRFNDGQPVPDELVGQTIQELRQQFGAISAETQVIRGHWQYQTEIFRDELVR